MAGIEEYRNAANTAPSQRSSTQQALVNEAYKNGMTEIKNIDHATQQRVKTYGK